MLALDNLAGSATAAGKPYFISNGEPLPAGEIISRMLSAVGETPRIKNDFARPGNGRCNPGRGILAIDRTSQRSAAVQIRGRAPQHGPLVRPQRGSA